MKTNFHIQSNGNDVLAKNVEKAVKEFYKEKGYKASKIETLDIYYVADTNQTYVAITDTNKEKVEFHIKKNI